MPDDDKPESGHDHSEESIADRLIDLVESGQRRTLLIVGLALVANTLIVGGISGLDLALSFYGITGQATPATSNERSAAELGHTSSNADDDGPAPAPELPEPEDLEEPTPDGG